MMFEWTFEFGWFEDLEDEIPLLSGGILAITKKWWIESGQYDEGMLEWGGENLEQSIRAWMCGGEIVASHESKIGHIFARPPKPNPENRLVIQVQKNQKRAAKVWLDEYYFLFYKYHPEVRGHEEGDISSRIRLRYEHLTCMPFQWYVEKFRTAFDRNNLLDHNFFHIQHSQTGLCLSSAASPAMPEERLVLEPCSRETRRQRWSIVAGNRMLANREKKCIDAYVGRASLRTPLTWKCDWHSVIQGLSINQLWQWDLGREEEEDRLSFLEGKNEEEEGKMKETMNDLTHTSSSSSSITGLPGSPTDKRELNKKTKRKGRDHPPLMPRQPSGVSSLSTGRIFSFSHPDTLSLTGHDTIPIFRHFAVSDRSRCLVVDEDDEEYLRFEESRKKKIETSRKIPVRWKACNGVPIVKGKKKKDPLVSRQKNEEKDTLAKEDREKEKKKKEEEEEEEEEMVVDPMRFVPLWMLPPLSSRFGKRTLSQALTITDEAAAIYLKSPPQYID